MDSSESWEVASLDEFNFLKKEKKLKESIRDTRLKILHKMLLVIESMKKRRTYPVAGGNEYEKLSYFRRNVLEDSMPEIHGPTAVFNGFYRFSDKQTSTAEYTFAFDKEILFFVALNLHGIPCRIYFVIGSTVQAFHEYIMNGKVVEHTAKHNGNCFSIDFNGFLKDQTIVFSKNCAHHRAFKRVLEAIRNKINSLHSALGTSTPGSGSSTPVSEFEEIDERRITAIPTNVNKIKIHPLYITEDMCTPTQFIYPKRPVLGLIKGIPIYPRKNLLKLKTEGGWYREGREIKSPPAKPYRIVREKKLFAEFQTKPIEIDDITGKLMDAFHPNMTPKNSVYIDYDSEICKELDIKYSDCLIGFKGKEMVIRGFFVNRNYCFLVNYFIKEREYYRSVDLAIRRYESALVEWKRLIAKARRFIDIKKRIGM